MECRYRRVHAHGSESTNRGCRATWLSVGADLRSGSPRWRGGFHDPCHYGWWDDAGRAHGYEYQKTGAGAGAARHANRTTNETRRGMAGTPERATRAGTPGRRDKKQNNPRPGPTPAFFRRACFPADRPVNMTLLPPSRGATTEPAGCLSCPTPATPEPARVVKIGTLR